MGQTIRTIATMLVPLVIWGTTVPAIGAEGSSESKKSGYNSRMAISFREMNFDKNVLETTLTSNGFESGQTKMPIVGVGLAGEGSDGVRGEVSYYFSPGFRAKNGTREATVKSESLGIGIGKALGFFKIDVIVGGGYTRMDMEKADYTNSYVSQSYYFVEPRATIEIPLGKGLRLGLSGSKFFTSVTNTEPKDATRPDVDPARLSDWAVGASLIVHEGDY